jgi:hypothetical protein
LYQCGLFYNTVGIPDYAASNVGIIGGKDLEGSGHGLIEVLSRYLPGGATLNNDPYLLLLYSSVSKIGGSRKVFEM